MFKRFTERARRVIILAREEAERYHHEYLGTEHILLGILKDGGGIAITVLQKLGVDLKQLKQEVERNLPRSLNTLVVGEIPFTPKAKRCSNLPSKKPVSWGTTISVRSISSSAC